MLTARLAAALFLTATVLAPAPAQAWSRAGHMVSGAIAYRALVARDPAAAERAVALLRRHPDYATRFQPREADAGIGNEGLMLFMLAARWADDVRGTPFDRAHWHYVNYPVVVPGEQATPPAFPAEHIETALAASIATLEDRAASDSARAVALTWVFHLTGDIHQPLHSVARFGTLWPTGDAGGNRTWVRAEAGKRAINLHALWDGMVITGDRPGDVRNRAIELAAAHPESPVVAQRAVPPTDWGRVEGSALARELAYAGGALAAGTDSSGAVLLPEGYLARAKPAADRQVTLAGYRLAGLVGTAFGVPSAVRPASGRR